MTLVHFGWLTAQRYFKEAINSNIREILQNEMFNVMDTDFVPFGYIDDGLQPQGERDDKGDWWASERGQLYPFDDLNYDWSGRW